MIVFDERKYAEQIEKEEINTYYGILKKGISLAKLFFERGMSEEDIYKDFCKRFIILDESGNSDVKKTKINIMIKAAKKYPLLKEKTISFTMSEINFISSFDDDNFQKVIFTLFCIMKFNESDSFYLNNQEVLRMANINKNSKVCNNVLRYLINNEFFICKEAKINGYLGKVVFEPKECIKKLYTGNVVLEISDYRNLGYLYESFMSDGAGFMKCQSCGIIIPKKTNCQKYCKDCAKKNNIEKTLNNRKNRKV